LNLLKAEISREKDIRLVFKSKSTTINLLIQKPAKCYLFSTFFLLKCNN